MMQSQNTSTTRNGTGIELAQMLEQQQARPPHIERHRLGLAAQRALRLALRRQLLDFVVEALDRGCLRINRYGPGALGGPKPLQRGGHRALQQRPRLLCLRSVARQPPRSSWMMSAETCTNWLLRVSNAVFAEAISRLRTSADIVAISAIPSFTTSWSPRSDDARATRCGPASRATRCRTPARTRCNRSAIALRSDLPSAAGSLLRFSISQNFATGGGTGNETALA